LSVALSAERVFGKEVLSGFLPFGRIASLPCRWSMVLGFRKGRP
jgi:hypothetical protein